MVQDRNGGYFAKMCVAWWALDGRTILTKECISSETFLLAIDQQEVWEVFLWELGFCGGKYCITHKNAYTLLDSIRL